MDKELDFKPITQGLGFHPFSDGLPYAPVSKTQQTQTQAPRLSGSVPPASSSVIPRASTALRGAGAVAAGRPQFVLPTPKTVNPAPSSVAPAVELLDSHEQVYGWTYLFKRVFAYAIDSAITFSVCFAALMYALEKTHGTAELEGAPALWFLGLMVGLAFHWFFITAQELIFKTTVGKRWMGLRLFGGASAIFVRAFFFVPSVLFCGLGVFWALLDRKKRCWHDLVADLAPTEIARL